MNRFRMRQAAVPAAAFLLAMLTIIVTDADRLLAGALFYDHGWIGAHTAWAETWIHTGGRDLVRVVAVAALAMVTASCFMPALRAVRRQTVFVLLSVVLVTGIVGLLKHVTNVDCPWSLADYGGANPYVPLFGDRPEGLSPAACFPGAHSSSGFALLCFYFVLPGRWRWAGLAAGLAAGIVFSFGQEARGAHFLSHDLTSAAIAWTVQVCLSGVLLHHGIEPAIDSVLQPRLTV